MGKSDAEQMRGTKRIINISNTSNISPVKLLSQNFNLLRKEAVGVISNPNETLENKEIAFDNLELLVEQIDNAMNIEKMNLWPQIISFLSFSEVSLRKYAIWVCGTAVQNNSQTQKAFVEKGGLKIILKILKDSNEENEIRSKALYAVSGAIQHCEPGLTQFEKEGGYDTLLSLLETSDDLNIFRKVVFLLTSLLTQNKNAIITQIKDKPFNKQIIKLLGKFYAEDEDLADKILKIFLLEFKETSLFSKDEINELRIILPEIKKKHKNILTSTEWAELESKVQ
ncbi:5298_t:CDS:2 [Diversispora eburnea]|uniref:5298_t:CDS:1 n=1 Tax=Diversispora eburnea TaxID=1213867 RepID=A0A9N8V481_9GLOM|nr:5298_t:CDS:2 [Diversispora eburnea]